MGGGEANWDVLETRCCIFLQLNINKTVPWGTRNIENENQFVQLWQQLHNLSHKTCYYGTERGKMCELRVCFSTDFTFAHVRVCELSSLRTAAAWPGPSGCRFRKQPVHQILRV